jgi:hypothetical protein
VVVATLNNYRGVPAALAMLAILTLVFFFPRAFHLAGTSLQLAATWKQRDVPVSTLPRYAGSYSVSQACWPVSPE